MAEKTILIVDDEQGFIDALADALEFLKYRVLRASTVSEALSLLQRTNIDAATVDMMLSPGDDLSGRVSSQDAGYYLLSEMRTRFSQVPAICVSVVSDATTIANVRRLGYGYLRKGDTTLEKVIQSLQEITPDRAPKSEILKRMGNSYKGKL